MATKEDRKKFLNKHNLTKDTIKEWFKNICENNASVDTLVDNGYTWKDIPIEIMKDMPFVSFHSEKDIDAMANRILDAYNDSLTENNILEPVISENTEVANTKSVDETEEEKLLHKIQSGTPLSERELKNLIFEYEIEREEGENRRWSRTVVTISELCSHFFSIDWEEGLTEYQENEFYNQPIEVKKREYEKTIKVAEWIPYNKEILVEDDKEEEDFDEER